MNNLFSELKINKPEELTSPFSLYYCHKCKLLIPIKDKNDHILCHKLEDEEQKTRDKSLDGIEFNTRNFDKNKIKIDENNKSNLEENLFRGICSTINNVNNNGDTARERKNCSNSIFGNSSHSKNNNIFSNNCNFYHNNDNVF